MGVRNLYLRIAVPLVFVFLQVLLAGCGGGSSKLTGGGASPSGSQSAEPPNTTTVSDIQNQSGWQWCSATTSSGFPCASGIGTAVSWMAQHQTNPSLSGSSAQIFIGGPTGYSNALWWKELGGNNGPAHFEYDFWVFAPNPQASQAMEFDVNQSFNGTRWVFGTECNLNGNGHWDVWDSSAPSGHWVETGLGCPRLAPNTWAHFIWHFERINSQVHYGYLDINGTDYPVDVWGAAQANYNSYELNVAVQLDGDSTQQPYSIYIDNVTLRYW